MAPSMSCRSSAEAAWRLQRDFRSGLRAHLPAALLEQGNCLCSLTKLLRRKEWALQFRISASTTPALFKCGSLCRLRRRGVGLSR
jgi:hypothetical protein